MRTSSRIVTAAAVALSTCLGAFADVIHYCPPGANTQVCLDIAIPGSTAQAASGNIYMRLSAPTTYSWVAFGTGSGMSGANIFVLYQDGRGNVTLSPRTTTGHAPPQHDSSPTGAKLTLLAGSGVSSDGKTMTAVVSCANCLAWSGGGTLNVADTSSPFIAAWKSGSSLATTSLTAGISRHDGREVFGFNLNQARIAQDANPFDPATTTGSGTGTGTGTGIGGSTGSGSGVTVIAGPNKAILAAHGIIMALVFVVLYPLGSLLMAMVRKWLIHAVWQAVAFLLMWVGFALGIVAAKDRKMLFTNTHTVMGTIVVCLLVLQPVLGFMHHQHYTKYQSRGAVSHAHIWLGRALLAAGVINGAFGLQLANASNTLIISYAVVAGVIYVIYAAGSAFGAARQKRSAPMLSKTGSSSPPYRRPYV